MNNNPVLSDAIKADLEAVNQITIIPGILKVLCHNTGMGFAAVARVTDDKWVACFVKDEIGFGLKPGGELKLETTICNEIQQHHQPVAIDHVARDLTYACHHTPATYGFQSYISIPIFRKNGDFFGTLCAIDPNPAKVNNPETIEMFQLYAELIAFHLNTIEQLESSKSQLKTEQDTAELREQFIAVLGHDLRNPIGAVSSSVQVLQRMSLDTRAQKFIDIIRDSAYRMEDLINNMLDFARGRLGDGISLHIKKEYAIDEVLLQIINELRVRWPERQVYTHFELTQPVMCDSKRIAQLFSNLLGNAITHGASNQPIKIEAQSTEEGFTLSVSNAGEPISAAAIERLFHPFSRGEAKPGQQGLGLGLYISSEIARAHGGSLSVKSTPAETLFTFFLPAIPVK